MATSRTAIARAYVRLMDTYPSDKLAEGLVAYLAATGQKIDVDLLARDIAAELHRSKGLVTGSLVFSREHDKALVRDIEQAIAKATGSKDVALDVAVDPELIGGFVVDTPAGSYDASVVRMLNELETVR